MTVDVILGSISDREIGEKAMTMLKRFGVAGRMHVASAHRAADYLDEVVKTSECDVFIAIAGLSAALPGVVASQTNKPVIGVPVSGKVNLDAILSITQMPAGIPVAAVGLDRAENAALLAVQMLGIADPDLRLEFAAYRKELREKVISDDEALGN